MKPDSPYNSSVSRAPFTQRFIVPISVVFAGLIITTIIFFLVQGYPLKQCNHLLIWPLGFFVTIAVSIVLRTVLREKEQVEALILERTTELRESENNLSMTLQSIGDGLIVTDDKGHVTRMNPVAEKLTGWAMKDALGRPITEVFQVSNEETGQPIGNPVEKVLKEGLIVGLINHTILCSKDGTLRPIADSGAPIKGEGGQIKGSVLVFRDVSEERAAQRALAESEARYRSLFEESSVPVWEEDFSLVKGYFEKLRASGVDDFKAYFESNPEALTHCASLVKILDVNQESLRFFGVKSKSEISNNLNHFFIEDSFKVFKKELVALSEGKTTFSSEIPIRSLKGHIVHLMLRLSVVPGYEQSLSRVLVSFMDITERKDVETRVRISEQKFAAAFQSCPDPMAITDKENGTLIEVNNAFTSFFGFTRQESIGRTAFDLGLWMDVQDRNKMVILLNHSGSVDALEVRMKRKNGDTRSVLFFAKIITVNNLECILSITRDITEQKQAEEALRISETRYRSIVEHINDAFYIHDFKGNILDVNESACQMLGYNRNELVGRHLSKIDSPENTQLMKEHMNTLTAKGTVLFDGEHIRKDGTKVNVMVSGSIVSRDVDGIVQSFVRDITERKQVEKALLENEERFRQIFNNMADGAVIYQAIDDGQDFIFVATNHASEVLSKFKQEEVLGKRVTEQFPGISEMGLLDVFRRVWQTGIAERHPQSLYKDDRIVQWVENYVCRLPSGVIAAIYNDVTLRKQAEESLANGHNLLKTLINNLPDSIYVKDAQGRKILTNQADVEFVGAKSEQEILGKTDAEIFPKHLADLYESDDKVVIEQGQPIINREELVEDSFGIKRWLLTSKLPLKDQQGKITGLVGIGRDITERKMLEDKLLNMAHYDILTSLPNRTLFFERVTTALAKAKRSGKICALLFIDLDHFKKINDTLGHTIGDALLKDSAVKLTECIRESDTLARLGGDEFIIFLNGIETPESAQFIASRVKEKFNIPRIIERNDLFITGSIGIAIYPEDGIDLETLLKNADTAMYAAKEVGRNTSCFFNPVMNRKAVTKMQVERGLREASNKNEFVLYYQPIINMQTGTIRGFEALLRWFRSEGGLIFPNEFIPIAEETGLIVPIGEWVLKTACKFNKMLIDKKLGEFTMAVNISVAQLKRKNFIDTIKTALAETGLPPQCLEIEITESMLIDSFDAAMDVLKDIRQLGVNISLDDFGTGYSSLSHLQKLPIVNLKIDRSFVENILPDHKERDLTQSIIDLAHQLKLGVIAEGVETQVQFNQLQQHNCDYFQGFYFSKPLSETEVLKFLENSSNS